MTFVFLQRGQVLREGIPIENYCPFSFHMLPVTHRHVTLSVIDVSQITFILALLILLYNSYYRIRMEQDHIQIIEYSDNKIIHTHKKKIISYFFFFFA